MPSSQTNVLCSLLFLACLFQQRCYLVEADQALINSVCEKTGKNNQFCHDCFKRDSRSPTEDIKGLALTSIDCGSTTAFDARAETASLAARSTDPTFKQKCNTCLGELDATFGDFGQAKTSAGAGNKVAATNSLNDALRKAADCLNLVGRGPVPKLATLQGFIDVAINVVNQIP
ncbi:OLC1v1035411C1 [Oldenlandia corymbosa var. corymbosa]|uniref:OLC1v1035411C1 n=1 Tax=Oldenlandia corymbosa var. corymbosa TaxID=529605 RepID=A0AAV1CTM8_OLDCO|nr:OLC1v1035411C1 [Oldenlandia corymbosa var. corymbosa]